MMRKFNNNEIGNVSGGLTRAFGNGYITLNFENKEEKEAYKKFLRDKRSPKNKEYADIDKYGNTVVKDTSDCIDFINYCEKNDLLKYDPLTGRPNIGFSDYDYGMFNHEHLV